MASKELWLKVFLKETAQAAAIEGVRKAPSWIERVFKDSLDKRLRRLEKLLSKGRISQDEYDRLRGKIIDSCSPKDI